MAEEIGFIGLGSMGAGMAANVLAAGYALKAFNRDASKAQPLVAKGATLASSAAAAARPGGIVVTVVSDDKALHAVGGEELARALGKGGLHLSMSTVLPSTNETLAEIYARHGATLVAAPVFGRPEAAAAKKLNICMSGPSAAKERARPVLEAMGQAIYDFGETVGAANVVKLSGNFLLTAAIESMAEASVLAEKNGIPREKMLSFFTQTLFNCPIYTLYARRLVDADFDKAGFTLQLASKDMRLALETAAASNATMPVLSLLRDRYVSAIAKGRGKMDASAIALGAADDAGLKW